MCLNDLGEAPHVLEGRRSVERYGRVLRRPVDGRLLFLRQEGLRTAFFNLPDEPRGKSDDGSLRAHKYASHHDELREAAGFDVEATFGGFGGEAFDEEESDHLIFAARRRD